MPRQRSRVKNGVLATVIVLFATPWLVECKQLGGKGGGLPGVGEGCRRCQDQRNCQNQRFHALPQCNLRLGKFIPIAIGG